MPRVRFTIGRLMIAVAVAGLISAWLRVPDAGAFTVASVLILNPPAIGLVYLFRFAKPGHRLLAATWVAAWWPLTIPWSLHAGWAAAYVYLGRAPGPGDFGPVFHFAQGWVLVFMLLSLFSPIVCLFLAFFPKERVVGGRPGSPAMMPVLLIPVAWFLAAGICGLTPVNAISLFISF
jgi:hypothetical protein